MTRIFLRYFNAPGLILLAIAAIAVQTSLFNIYPFIYLQPDLILLFVLWVALKREFIEGGILTLILAQLAEIHSSAPAGMYFTTYMLIYLIVKGLARYIMIASLTSMLGLTLFASIFWKLSGLGLLHLLGLSDNQWRHTLALLLPGAVMEVVVATWVYRWLDRYDWKTFKDPRARQLLDDELLLGDEGL